MNHLIKSPTLLLEIPKSMEPLKAQDLFGDLFYQDLLHQLEMACDDIDDHLVVDSMEIGLKVKKDRIHVEWAPQVAKAFHEQLQIHQKQKSDNVKYPDQHDHSALELLVYYLTNGVLPWWSEKFAPVDLNKLLKSELEQDKETAVSNLLSTLKNLTTIERFIHGFSDASFQLLIEELLSNHKSLFQAKHLVNWISYCQESISSSTSGYSDFEIRLKSTLLYAAVQSKLQHKELFKAILTTINFSLKRSAEVVSFLKKLIAHSREMSDRAFVTQFGFEQQLVAFQLTEFIWKTLNKEQQNQLLISNEVKEWLKSYGVSPAAEELREKRTKEVEDKSPKDNVDPGVDDSSGSGHNPSGSGNHTSENGETAKAQHLTKEKNSDEDIGSEGPNTDATQPAKVVEEEAERESSMSYSQKELEELEPDENSPAKTEEGTLSSTGESNSVESVNDESLESRDDNSRQDSSADASGNFEMPKQNSTSEVTQNSRSGDDADASNKDSILESSVTSEMESDKRSMSDPLSTQTGAQIIGSHDAEIDSDRKSPTDNIETLLNQLESAENSAWNDEFEEPENVEVYVKNAGVILFWPYINKLFDNLEFTKNGEFKNNQAQIQAACALEYLVYEQPDLSEYALPLNKVLCGIPIKAPTRGIVLEEEQLPSIETLISSVITNWSALKNTSIDGFRTSFVQREGKLTYQNRSWLLQVEKTGIDILLDTLPWQIGLVKLPWMKKPMYVEW